MSNYEFVGIDIAKDKFNVACMFGNKFYNQVFLNTVKGFEAFLAWLNQKTLNPWVCMEATGHYSEILADFLHAQKIQVSVVNPLQIKHFAKSILNRNKNDILDAQVIAKYCHITQPKVFTPRPQQIKELRDLIKLQDTLKLQQQQLKNQLHSSQGNAAIKKLKHFINILETDLLNLENDIEELTKSETEIHNKITMLTTIKGIGKLTAQKLIATITDIRQFKTTKQFAAYIGITPMHHQSGKRAGKTTISRLGDPNLRKTLYMAALVAKRFNPALNIFVKRLEDKNKAPKSIVCAVMRKLAHIIFGMLKNKQTFNPALV